MNPGDLIEVPVSGSVMLVVSVSRQPRTHSRTVAAIYKGTWPSGTKLACTVCMSADVYVADDTSGIWFNETIVPLSWSNLLKVADFLHLDIPQPVIAPARGSIVDVHA